MNAKLLGVVIALLVAIFIAYNAYFVVTPRERVVLVQVGDIVGANYKPGLHFKIPFIQKVRVFDDRILTLTGQIDRVLTSENKNLAVSYYVKWQISDTVAYFKSTHGDISQARGLLSDLVESDLLTAFSKRTIQQAVGNERSESTAEVQVQVNKDAKRLGIDVVDVRITKLNLPKAVSESVYQRMRTERSEVIQTLRAQGDAAAREIRADAKRARTEILASAYRQAQLIKGKGDATAAQIYAKAYKQSADFYSFYRTLEVYRNTIGKGDLLFLAPDGELFKYFNPKSGGGKPSRSARPGSAGGGSGTRSSGDTSTNAGGGKRAGTNANSGSSNSGNDAGGDQTSSAAANAPGAR